MTNIQKLITILVVLAIALGNVKSQPMINYQKSENDNFFSVKKKYDEYWLQSENKGKSGWKQYKRWENFWSTRVNQDGTFPNAKDIITETKTFKQIYPQSGIERIWKKIGPNQNPESPQSGIGRVNVVKFKPNTQDEIWIGAASGGVWHTTNHGSSWNVFDFTETLSMGISDIAFCYNHPDVAYVATGDADGIGASYGSYSAGVIKTTDGGNTWNFTNLSYETSQGKIVSRLIVNPDNPDIVIAGTSDGIYKSVDGGITWRMKTTTNGYYRDLEHKPDDPNVIVSVTYSGGGTAAIYKSTDGGDSWNQVKSLNGVTRSVISFSPVNPSTVFVLSSQGQSFHSFYKSTDAGSNWTMTASVSTHPNMLGYNQGLGNDKYTGQAWYDIAIAASPINENEVYTGGINIWKTTDGGNSWSMVSHWYGGYSKPYVHADIHDLFFDEMSGFLYCGSDGGLDYSDSPSDWWINLNNTLSITQYYKIAISPNKAGLVYGGSQDNGSHKLEDGKWVKVAGGDGMDCAVDYTDSKRAFVSMYYGTFMKTINGANFYEVLNQDMTGENGDWVAPLIMNPVNPKSIYAGFRNVWKSVDGGSNWNKISNINFGTLKLLAISSTDTNYVYAANSGNLAVSKDGGKTFTAIAGAPTPITGITIDKKDPNRIWITVGGFAKGTKVMQFNGSTWINMTGNLPNVPVNCIIFQHNSPDRLYIGTDIGVFSSDYNSGYWSLYGSQIPDIIISDLEIDYKSKILYAGSYGRGAWQISLDECNESQPEVAVSGQSTFCQGGSVTLTAQSTGENFLWSTGETTQSIVVSTPGLYSYSVTNPNGCIARSKSIEVRIFNVPQMKISTFGNYPVCEGDTFDLELSATFGFNSYLWSTGETSRKIKLLQPGKYSVTGFTKDNCESKADLDVVINTIPEKPVITRWSSTYLISSIAKAYQWYFNDAKLPGDTNQTLLIRDIGDYIVETFNEAGCSNISDKYNVISGVDDLINSDLMIYPNPTSGKLTLKLNNSEIGLTEISISDIYGNNHKLNWNLDKDYYTFDISELSSGIYFLKIKFMNQSIIRKVIKL